MVALKSAKPKQQEKPDYEALYKAEVAKREALEAEAANKATKSSKKQRSESPFTAEDVQSLSQQDWFDLKELFIARNNDGSMKTMIGKSGSSRVVIVPGLDYGVYRWIKGVARNMRYRDFDGLSEAQIEAGRNILAYCLEHDLVESPEATPVEQPKRKPGRPAGSKNRK